MKKKVLAALLAAAMTVSVFGTSFVASAATVDNLGESKMVQGNPYDVPISIKSMTCNYGHNALVGQQLVLGIEGSESAVRYAFQYSLNGKDAVKIYEGTADSCTFTPKEAGDYWIDMTAFHPNGTAMTNAYEVKVTNDGTQVTTPLNLKGTKTDWDTATLTWDAASTNKGAIAGYEVYCNGKAVAFTTTTSADVSLIKGDNDFTVAAVTENDIYSEQSAKVNVFRYYSDLSLASLKMSNSNPTVGSAVKFTVDAKAHSNLKYKYVVVGPDGKKALEAADVASNMLNWVPQETGSYYAYAYAYTNDTYPGDTYADQGDSVASTNTVYFTVK